MPVVCPTTETKQSFPNSGENISQVSFVLNDSGNGVPNWGTNIETLSS